MRSKNLALTKEAAASSSSIRSSAGRTDFLFPTIKSELRRSLIRLSHPPRSRPGQQPRERPPLHTVVVVSTSIGPQGTEDSRGHSLLPVVHSPAKKKAVGRRQAPKLLMRATAQPTAATKIRLTAAPKSSTLAHGPRGSSPAADQAPQGIKWRALACQRGQAQNRQQVTEGEKRKGGEKSPHPSAPKKADPTGTAYPHPLRPPKHGRGDQRNQSPHLPAISTPAEPRGPTKPQPRPRRGRKQGYGRIGCRKGPLHLAAARSLPKLFPTAPRED
ncbi:hypothetical protein NDU88_003366 [Pleurodeles waltl]|uniref:Uncharacterized protein n=1 Tax=Pleurodeles waltl TaxID=8319 RepID=A0AAV7SF13_PLEWA|nr:hypothetical protein NDU88_003366 [Pleurodeles waltl]